MSEDTFTQWLEPWIQRVGDDPWWQVGAILLASVIVALLVNWLVTGVFLVWARRTETDLDDRLVKALHRPVFLSVFLIGLWVATKRFDLGQAWSTLALRLIKTFAILVWAQFGFRLSTILMEAASHLQDHFKIIDERTLPLFEKLAKVVVLCAAVYFFFLSWGINVAAWMAGVGIVGIAVGYAAKDTLANLFAGIFILADAPYQKGDFVILDSGERGRVTHIGLRSTRLLTRDDIEVTVPNAVIGNAKIINETGGPWEKERVRVKVSVAYGSDLRAVKELLVDIANQHSELCTQPAPRVRVRGFGDSGVQIELLGWIEEPVLRGRLLDALYTEVYETLRENDVEIPFPQRDLWLRSGEISAGGGSDGE